MATKTQLVLNLLSLAFWIIFIGLCIKTGTILYSWLLSMTFNSAASANLYLGMDFSPLLDFNLYHYFMLGAILIAITAFQAYIAYLVINILLKLRIREPFSEEILWHIKKIARLALATAFLALYAEGYSKWLDAKQITLAVDWAGGEILFFAGIIYLIAQIFQRGLKLQKENELTI